ncbi:hypothetical protein [Streptomyces sp. NBC_00353]|uniref:hypothetical protein n=1 Tax=unclassified Streptomyces TaxID=2593676 RepID=UPI002E264796
MTAHQPRPIATAIPNQRELTLCEEENAEAENGCGLLIVEALAGLWNSSPNGRGKTVSVEVPILET